MVRLSDEMADRFQALTEEFRGLPNATVMRLLVAELLEAPLEEQVRLVTRQIRKGSDGPNKSAGLPVLSARPKLNTTRRSSER